MEATRSRTRVPTWAAALAPLGLLVGLVLLIVISDPLGRLRSASPVDSVAVERTVLRPGSIRLDLRNNGPGKVSIAQVVVNDAFWHYTSSRATMGRLGTSTVEVDYPWEEGLPVHLGLVTSAGATFGHDIASAAATPVVEASSFRDYGLVGLLIGVVPVALGLLWLPAVRRASAGVIRFVLALTVGLLAFLLAETTAEGLDIAADVPVALRGVELFVVGALTVVAGMAWLQWTLRQRHAPVATGSGGAPALGGLPLAYLVAVGIGLHNLGEGLAVGAAVAAGEVALGTTLVLGFAVHNTTEGIAIASPIAGGDVEVPPSWPHLGALVLIAGAPTIVGAWAGAFLFTPAWAAFAFGLAAGAIAEVIWSIGRRLVASGVPGAVALGFLSGVAVMYTTSLLTS